MILKNGGDGANGDGLFGLFALSAVNFFYVTADSIACIASLWVLSARTGQALQVGVILGLGALLPPLLARLRRASPRVDETRNLLLARGFGLVTCLAAVPVAANLGAPAVAYAVLLASSLTDVCTIFSVETIIGTLVLRLPRERHELIARAQMLGAQFAMFPGAAVSGFSFQWLGYLGALVVAAAVAASGLAVQWRASKVLAVPSRDAAVVAARECALEPGRPDSAFALWMLPAGVFIGFSLTALRIKQRARLFLRLRCPDDARSWGSRMATQTVLQRALLPVALGTLLRVSTPSRVFLLSVLLAFLLMGLLLYRQQHSTA